MHHSNAQPELWPLFFFFFFGLAIASAAHLHARWSAQTQLAVNSSGCWMAGWKASNVGRRASADAHPTRWAGWGVIDWEADYASFGQVVGRQRDTHHLAAASAKVWGRAFLASACRDKHHRNNKKTHCCQSPNVGVFFCCCCCLSVVGSCLFI